MVALAGGARVSNTYSILKTATLGQVRLAIRSGQYRSHTAGLGQGYLQSNLAIMPQEYALDFMRFCQRNPKPCPVTGVSDTGNPMMFTMGRDIDIRTDVPAYNVYRNGRLDHDCNDISDIWSDDLVVFALGCSFTFEHALMRAGFSMWHIDHDLTVLAGTITLIAVQSWPVLARSLANGSRANTPLETPLAWVQTPWFAGWVWFALMAWLTLLAAIVMLAKGEFDRADAVIGTQSETEATT
jgi:hypothetical protein